MEVTALPTEPQPLPEVPVVKMSSTSVVVGVWTKEFLKKCNHNLNKRNWPQTWKLDLCRTQNIPFPNENVKNEGKMVYKYCQPGSHSTGPNAALQLHNLPM